MNPKLKKAADRLLWKRKKRLRKSVRRRRASETARKGRSRNAGRTPLTDAQRNLAERYLRMARALAKPFKLRYPHESDEYESAACMALVEAAQAFDPARHVKFGTFALYRITGELREVQRRLAPRGWENDRANAPLRISLRAQHEESGHVLLCQPEEPVVETIDDPIAVVESWLRMLPRQHSRALRELYIHGLTFPGAAQVLGRTVSRVGYLHAESLEMLKECLAVRSGQVWRTALTECDPPATEDPTGGPDSCSS
jgi:RNA polymerase sigma factor (sigma-70 family)